jgi:DNA repair protein RadC
MHNASQPDPTLHDLETKLRIHGPNSLTVEELLVLLLADVPDTSRLVRYLLAQFPRLTDLQQAPMDALVDVPGIGKARALRIKAALALSQHLHNPATEEKPLIKRPSDAVKHVRARFAQLPQEQLIVLLLDVHNQLNAMKTIYIGSLNATSVRVAEVLRTAIISNSAALIVLHNHPSGQLTPSPDDIDFTRSIIAAGRLMDIAVLDHIIMGDGDWLSMREKQIAFQPPEDTTPSSSD